MEEEPFPSVPTPEAPYVVTLPAHPCHREFPYAPPQQMRRLQELLSQQRAQNKLAKAFDQHVAFQNVRSARSGPDGDGGVYSIIDTPIETNVDQLNVASTGQPLTLIHTSKGTAFTQGCTRVIASRLQSPIQNTKEEWQLHGESNRRRTSPIPSPTKTLNHSRGMALIASPTMLYSAAQDSP